MGSAARPEPVVHHGPWLRPLDHVLARLAVNEAGQLLARHDRGGVCVIGGVADGGVPGGGSLRHVVEDARADEVDQPARVDVEQEHRPVGAVGIGEPGDHREPGAVDITHLPHLTGGTDPWEQP